MTDTLTAPIVERLDAPLTLAAEPTEAGAREFECLAVPYEVEIDRSNWMLGTRKLKIAKGAAKFRDDAKVFFGHDWADAVGGMPIGRVLSAVDEDAGPKVRGRLSATAKADEVWTLMQPDKDGQAVLDRVSIGFQIVAYSVEGADTDAPVLVVTEADVFEVSVVPYPAYSEAQIESVLSARLSARPTEGKTPMTVEITERQQAPAAGDTEALQRLADNQDSLAEALAEIERKLAVLGEARAPETPAALFSSFGEYVHAMLSGDSNAAQLAEDYQGGKSPDTTVREPWVGDTIRLIEKARKVWGLFENSPLPAEGNKLEYGVLKSNTIDVQRQIDEGDDLVMGNITIGTDHADVRTYGGAASMSFQKAKRSSIPVLDLTFRALAIAYGKTTEQALRAIVGAAAAKQIGTLAQFDDYDGWIDFFVDSAMHLDDKGLGIDYLRLSPDQFKRMAKLQEGADGPYLFDRATGTLNLTEVTGSVEGVKVAVTPGTNLIEVGNKTAVRTFESAGAPLRLGPKENILDLTEDLGVYGFAAFAVQDAEALVRPGA